MLVDFGRASLLGKLRQQPEKAREILAKIKSNGLVATVEAIRSKLSQPTPLGYCNVGFVVESHDDHFRAGDRIVSKGPHAEAVAVQVEHCAKIPTAVSNEAAAFTPLAAIALQGIHLLDTKPGDKVVVVGLGLIGQLAARLLIAKGCDVMGLDPSAARCEMARKHGVQIPINSNPVAAALAWTNGRGVAGVLITASTPSHLPVSQAARSCRHRGRVVLVGVVGLNLNRADFYQNEVSFQVSRSYGERNHTGVGSVRANFEEALGHLAAGRFNIEDLITQRISFNQAEVAYDQLTNDKSALGILFDYTDISEKTLSKTIELKARKNNALGLSLIGAGNFATRTLLPALKKLSAEANLELVVSNQGHQALLAARQFGASSASTDEAIAFTPEAPRGLFLCTRHDSHARLAIAALKAGKSVWVEKPLVLSVKQLEEVAVSVRQSKGVLMVGFNRRFAPATTRLRTAIEQRAEPKIIHITVNAGALAANHWALDATAGGGRIVGEACHFIDLARHLIGQPIRSVRCTRRDTDGQDGGCYEITFLDGSIATIDYRTDLPPEIPKEHIKVSGKNWSAEIHNWARLTSVGLGASCGWPWSRAPHKGHPEALNAFLSAVNGKSPTPIPFEEIFEVSLVAIQMQGMIGGQSITL